MALAKSKRRGPTGEFQITLAPTAVRIELLSWRQRPGRAVDWPLNVPAAIVLLQVDASFLTSSVASNNEPASANTAPLIQTATGVFLFTTNYASPEQISGTPITTCSDIYSLGCLLFEALCGEPPFDGNFAEVLGRHQFVPPPSPKELQPQTPPALESLLLRCLAKSPESQGKNPGGSQGRLSSSSPEIRRAPATAKAAAAGRGVRDRAAATATRSSLGRGPAKRPAWAA